MLCFQADTAQTKSVFVFWRHLCWSVHVNVAARMGRVNNSNAGTTGAAHTPPTRSSTCSCNKQVKCHLRWEMWNTPQKVNWRACGQKTPMKSPNKIGSKLIFNSNNPKKKKKCVCVAWVSASTAPPEDATLTEKLRKTFLPLLGKPGSPRSRKQQKAGKPAPPGRRCWALFVGLKTKEGDRISGVTRVSRVPLTRSQRRRPPRCGVPSSVASSRGDGPPRARILIALWCQHGENSTIGTTAPTWRSPQ